MTKLLLVIVCAALLGACATTPVVAPAVEEAVAATPAPNANEAMNDEADQLSKTPPANQADAAPTGQAAQAVPAAADAPVPGQVAAGPVFVARVSDGVVLYAEPSNKSAVQGLLKQNDEAVLIGEEQNGYINVQGTVSRGWADKSLLTRQGETIANVKIKPVTKAAAVRRSQPAYPKANAAELLARTEKVVLYSAEWCPYCTKARHYLNRNGVAFEEHDIETSSKGVRDYAALDGDGIPIILVNGHKIVGWKQAEFNRHYGGIAEQAVVAAVAEPRPAPPARVMAVPASVATHDSGVYVPKVTGGIVVYSQPTNRSTVGGLLQSSEQVTALGEEANGYVRVQGAQVSGWVDKQLLRKL